MVNNNDGNQNTTKHNTVYQKVLRLRAFWVDDLYGSVLTRYT